MIWHHFRKWFLRNFPKMEEKLGHCKNVGVAKWKRLCSDGKQGSQAGNSNLFEGCYSCTIYCILCTFSCFSNLKPCWINVFFKQYKNKFRSKRKVIWHFFRKWLRTFQKWSDSVKKTNLKENRDSEIIPLANRCCWKSYDSF